MTAADTVKSDARYMRVPTIPVTIMLSGSICSLRSVKNMTRNDANMTHPDTVSKTDPENKYIIIPNPAAVRSSMEGYCQESGVWQRLHFPPWMMKDTTG